MFAFIWLKPEMRGNTRNSGASKIRETTLSCFVRSVCAEEILQTRISQRLKWRSHPVEMGREQKNEQLCCVVAFNSMVLFPSFYFVPFLFWLCDGIVEYTKWLEWNAHLDGPTNAQGSNMLYYYYCVRKVSKWRDRQKITSKTFDSRHPSQLIFASTANSIHLFSDDRSHTFFFSRSCSEKVRKLFSTFNTAWHWGGADGK